MIFVYLCVIHSAEFSIVLWNYPKIAFSVSCVWFEGDPVFLQKILEVSLAGAQIFSSDFVGRILELTQNQALISLYRLLIIHEKHSRT